jgi:hypothetical protein
MKENVLRKMIRKQIKTSLKESPDLATGRVGASLGRVEKMAGVKMLKKALDTGSPQQQAAGLLKVIKAISGNNPTVGKMLGRMLMKGGITSDTAPEVAEENYTAGIDDNEAGTSLEEASSALASRMGRVDKTQAMVQMKKMLATRPATQQTDFVIDMINGLELKDSAKKRLLLKLRQGLE